MKKNTEQSSSIFFFNANKSSIFLFLIHYFRIFDFYRKIRLRCLRCLRGSTTTQKKIKMKMIYNLLKLIKFQFLNFKITFIL